MLKNNKLFETLLTHSLEGIYLLQNFGEMIYVNSAFCKILGYTEEELIGKNLIQFIHPHDQEVVSINIKKRELNISVSEHYEFRCIGKTGESIFVEAKGIRVDDFNGKPAIIGTLKDISERRKNEERLNLFMKVFHSNTSAIIITDYRNQIIEVNASFEQITGYSRAEVLGKNPNIFSSGNHDKEFYKTMWAELLAHSKWQGEIWDKRKDGTHYPKWLSVFVVRNEHNVIQNFVAEFTDITDQKKAEVQARQLKFFDALTNLPNRLLLVEKIKELISTHNYYPIDLDQTLKTIESEQILKNEQVYLDSEIDDFDETSAFNKNLDQYFQNNQNQISVLFLNLDRFKNINDTLGHSIGDQLIKEVAIRLQTYVEGLSYLVSRVGNDEFVLVMHNITRLEVTQKIKHLLKKLSLPYFITGQQMPLTVTASIGISMYPEDDQDVEGLIKKAHIAMYQSKYLGRRTYCFFSSDLYEKYTERLYLEHHLREALKTKNDTSIEESQLMLYYQPKINLIDRKIVGVEALLRWKHPVMGFISPAKFIPTAEESGLIIDLSEWVIREACLQFNRWIKLGLPAIQVAVNISGTHFLQDNFTMKLSRIIAETEMNPNFLELEITEGVFLDSDETEIIKKFELLHYLGLKLSLDDFGTGYSALNYLHQFPIDYLKIDQSFIRQMTSNPSMMMIVESITKLARRLGLQVIAEGVEYFEELEILLKNECDQVQGFYYSQALPPDKFIEFYKTYMNKLENLNTQSFDPYI